MLALAAVLILICFIWIERDPLMQEAFSIYGRAFRTAIEMKAWDIMFKCGWRLALVLATIAFTLWFATNHLVFQREIDSTFVSFTWAILAFSAALLVPFPFMAAYVRDRRRIDNLVDRLQQTVKGILDSPDMSQAYELADYENDGDWIAWHPKQEEYKRSVDIWQRIVPVFYTSPSNNRTVVIPIDWSNFCVWGNLPPLPARGDTLPFHGPGCTKFRFLSARIPKTSTECSIIHADMDITDDSKNG